MPKYSGELEQLFHALGDSTRRRVVERLADGPCATTALAEPFEMSLPSFTQHMGVLERAGLVTSTKQGRVRTYHLAPDGLATAGHWLDDQRRLWTTRLDQLDELVIQIDKAEKADKEKP